MRPLYARLLIAVLLIAAIALPLGVPNYYTQFATKVLILGILAMALNLVVGFGGLVSLCHAAFYGLAGYALALAAPKYEPASLWLTLPLAVGAAAAAALVIGALSLRTRGIYFIMVTLAFGEMLFYLFHDTKFAGGSDGTFINISPKLRCSASRSSISTRRACSTGWCSRSPSLTIALLRTADALAVRPRARRRARQRAARPLARLSDLSPAPHRVRDLRRARRTRRLFRRRAVRLRGAADARLAPVGDRAGDGRARRHAAASRGPLIGASS